MCELISINIYKRVNAIIESCSSRETVVTGSIQLCHGSRFCTVFDVFVSFVILSFSVYIFLLSSVIPCLFLLLTAFYCLYPTGPYSRKQVQQNTKSEVDNFEFPVR